MAAMQAQVEPHFLFSTLGSIDHPVETDPARASKMQKNLIALLRASMPRCASRANLGRAGRDPGPYLDPEGCGWRERLQTEIPRRRRPALRRNSRR